MSVFSLVRQLTTWHCPHSVATAARLLLTAGRAATDQPPVGRAHRIKPAAAAYGSIMGRTDRLDRQRNGRTPDNCIVPASHAMRVVSISRLGATVLSWRDILRA